MGIFIVNLNGITLDNNFNFNDKNFNSCQIFGLLKQN